MIKHIAKTIITTSIILLIIIVIILYLFRLKIDNQKISSYTTPTPVVKTISTLDQISHALSQKNNWDRLNLDVTIATIEGNFAKGNVKFKNEMGGGLWFAARQNGEWKIVHDGNGIITCEELDNYTSFPKNLIPACYDEKKGELINR